MNINAQLVIGIFLLAVAFPGGVWVIWRDIRSGNTTLNLNNGRAIGSGSEIPSSRDQSPVFYWFTICVYSFGTLAALCLGVLAMIDFAKH
jgi:hypothetical protein